MSDKEKIVLLYDGYCNFCTSLVFGLKKLDKDRRIQSIPASTEKGEKLVDKYNIDEDLTSTLGLVKEEQVYFRSDAVFEILKTIGGFWGWFYFLKKVIPRKLRDGVYKLIAKYRYKIFGKHDSCQHV